MDRPPVAGQAIDGEIVIVDDPALVANASAHDLTCARLDGVVRDRVHDREAVCRAEFDVDRLPQVQPRLRYGRRYGRKWLRRRIPAPRRRRRRQIFVCFPAQILPTALAEVALERGRFAARHTGSFSCGHRLVASLSTPTCHGKWASLQPLGDVGPLTRLASRVATGEALAMEASEWDPTGEAEDRIASAASGLDLSELGLTTLPPTWTLACPTCGSSTSPATTSGSFPRS